jgi:hypothetical protein
MEIGNSARDAGSLPLSPGILVVKTLKKYNCVSLDLIGNVKGYLNGLSLRPKFSKFLFNGIMILFQKSQESNILIKNFTLNGGQKFECM